MRAPWESVSESVTTPVPRGADRARRLMARAQGLSPSVQALVALACYLAIWVLTESLPLLENPGRPQLDQASMDPNFYVWCLRWWPYALAHGLNPLHSAQIGAPNGFDLAWVTTIPPLALLTAPITLLAGPVVSFSLLVSAAIPVSGWAAFVLCRRLTQRFWASLAGGAIYGFSAYEMNHIVSGQLNLAFSLLLPLMAYLVVAWRDRAIGPRVFIALMGVAMALQCYLFLETFAELTVVLVLAFAAGYVLASRPDRPQIARLAGLVGIAYAIALVLASPYLAYALTHMPSGFARSPAGPSLKLAGLVVPWPGHTFGLSWLASAAADLPGPGLDGYLGVPLVILAVALTVACWSRRIVRFLAVAIVALIIVSLGPTLHLDAWTPVARLPWSGLWNLPIARSAYPARFMVFVQLAIAVMTALWLAMPRQRWWAWGARWALAVLALAAITSNTPPLDLTNQAGLPGFIAAGHYRDRLTPGEIVVVLSERGNAGMLWQASTGFYTRLAGGYINQAISASAGIPGPIARLSTGGLTQPDVQRFRAYLKNAGIGAILVETQADQAGPWRNIFRQLGLRGEPAAGVTVYPT